MTLVNSDPPARKLFSCKRGLLYQLYHICTPVFTCLIDWTNYSRQVKVGWALGRPCVDVRHLRKLASERSPWLLPSYTVYSLECICYLCNIVLELFISAVSTIFHSIYCVLSPAYLTMCIDWETRSGKPLAKQLGQVVMINNGDHFLYLVYDSYDLISLWYVLDMLEACRLTIFSDKCII